MQMRICQMYYFLQNTFTVAQETIKPRESALHVEVQRLCVL